MVQCFEYTLHEYWTHGRTMNDLYTVNEKIVTKDFDGHRIKHYCSLITGSNGDYG